MIPKSDNSAYVKISVFLFLKYRAGSNSNRFSNDYNWTRNEVKIRDSISDPHCT